jgi:hypothetical protein
MWHLPLSVDDPRQMRNGCRPFHADYGRTTYRPPANLTDHVIARDHTCTFPGCRRPARLCDLDHTEAWTDGGDTNSHNITALCARHHNAKHDARWQVKRLRDGGSAWTSPTGHTYVRPPDDG